MTRPIPPLPADLGSRSGSVAGEGSLREASNIRLFWRLQCAGWSLAFLFGALVWAPVFGVVDAVFAAGLRTMCGFIGTCFLRELYRRLPWRRFSPWVLLVCALLLSVALGLAETAISRQVPFYNQLRALLSPELLPVLERMAFVLRCGGFFGWSVLYFAILLWREWEGSALRAARTEAAARTAELRQLQAQLNPHFLFNALNTIVAQKDDGPAVEKATEELADYLRHALRPQEDFAPLGQELDLIERYLRVEKTRFEERLEFAIEADPAARLAPTPAALVQPLLENACKHGRRVEARVLRLRVTARVEEEVLVVEVANSGRWIDAPAGDSHGIGLANLRRRLELLAPGRALLSHREEAGWVIARVVWPTGVGAAARGLREALA
jgi:hypothetical protein